MAPWTHTYLSPQTERRICCASREPASSFEQYIDSAPGSGSYTPVTLEQHWNSERMRAVRLKMLRNEVPAECEVCDNQLLNTDVYRSYFNQLFEHKWPEVAATTDATGRTTMLPVSWDYRFSNLCNFKCRTCGSMLSSAWESEERANNMIDWSNTQVNWMRPETRNKITAFQDTQIEQEFAQAVAQHRIEEVYWVGGEPLMYEQHWRYMKQIIDQGDGKNVYARYNTNLSRVDYGGSNLFNDVVAHLRDWQICASLDGTGRTGEYIRTGLNYSTFLENFKQGLTYARHPRQMRIDFTLTLPGLFEVENIQHLADELGVSILAKIIFSFSPEIIMSPLALPRELLDKTVDRLAATVPAGAMRDVLLQLKSRQTFAEQWPDTYLDTLARARRRVEQIEQIRRDTYTLRDILSADTEMVNWYDSIPA